VEASDRAELERMREQLLRTAADFDNFRKRSRRELEDAKRVAREDVVRDLLPIFDNLERGMASAQRATEVKALAEGLQMILKQFLDTVAKMGVTKIPAVGSPFDPNVHEAIQQVETAEQAPGTVIAEVQPGYLLGERLLRAAMVVVAKSKAASASSEPGSGPAN
jgi:molecular chaperone GrpE